MLNDGINGLLTYIFARMSADEYNKSQESPINENLLIGENMKYQNKTIMRTKGSKTWYTRYRDEQGQHYISGKTQQEVYNKLKLALKNIAIEEDVKHYTLKYWITKWKKLYKSNLRERSIMEIDYYIDKIPTTLLKKEMRYISTIEIAEYVNNISGARQKQKVYTILNDIFDKAVKNEVITRNPLVVIEKPKFTAKTKYALSLEEENKLCEKIKGNKELYIYAIAMLQGIRPGELYALEYKDINFQTMTITINKAIDNKSFDEDVKNKYSNRIIPLFKKTYELIKDLDTSSNERLVQENEVTINRRLKELTKDITKEKISLYNLRHTFITRLADNNVPEHLIQHWAGQRIGSRVTKEVYTHISKETEDKYINILNK